MAPRNIYTRSNLELDPPKVVNDLEKLIKKNNLREIQARNNPLLRSHSLSERFQHLRILTLIRPSNLVFLEPNQKVFSKKQSLMKQF